MKRFMLITLFVFVVLGVAKADGDALLKKLAPQGDLSDFAQVFSADQKQACESFLREIRASTSAEVAVVTLPSLEGGEINDFANRLFQKWGIGKKKTDNGVLILVAVEDRKARIEVGYGLEGVLPDARTGRILDEVMLPCFRQGNYAEGVIKGVGTIGGIIAQGAGVTLTNMLASAVAAPAAAPPPAAPERKATKVEKAFFLFIIAIFLFFFIYAIIKGVKKSGKKGDSGDAVSGGGAGSSGGESSSGSGGFGGGSSGGGGASRGW